MPPGAPPSPFAFVPCDGRRHAEVHCGALPTTVDAATAPAASVPSSGVLRLSDAIEIGLKNQPAVKQAHALTMAAQARAIRPARRSCLRSRSSRRTSAAPDRLSSPAPSLAAAPHRAAFRSTPLRRRTGPASISSPSAAAQRSSSGIFNQVRGRARAADQLAMSAEEQERVTAYFTAANIRRSYFVARDQKALVKVAADTRDNVQRHLEQTRGFVNVGIQPDIALARAETDLANAEVALVNAQNNYTVAKATLASNIGDPAAAALEIADDEIDVVEGEDQPIDALVTQAMKARPEVRVLDRQSESLQLTIRALRGGYWPSLSASAGASETGTSLDRLGPAWNVGVTLSWPIFQGGITRAQVREAEANAQATLAQLEAQRLQIRVDVQQAALSLHAAKVSQAATERAAVNAREQLRLAEGRFAQGVGNAIELATRRWR